MDSSAAGRKHLCYACDTRMSSSSEVRAAVLSLNWQLDAVKVPALYTAPPCDKSKEQDAAEC